VDERDLAVPHLADGTDRKRLRRLLQQHLKPWSLGAGAQFIDV